MALTSHSPPSLSSLFSPVLSLFSPFIPISLPLLFSYPSPVLNFLLYISLPFFPHSFPPCTFSLTSSLLILLFYRCRFLCFYSFFHIFYFLSLSLATPFLSFSLTYSWTIQHTRYSLTLSLPLSPPLFSLFPPHIHPLFSTSLHSKAKLRHSIYFSFQTLFPLWSSLKPPYPP